MKYFVLLFFLTFINFTLLGRVYSVNPISQDTVFLINKIPNFNFNLSYIDKFGDYISIDGIEKNKIMSETPYIEIKTPFFNYWLRKGNYYELYGNYHDGFEPEMEISLKDRIQSDNEAMFFVHLYRENQNLSINFVQRQKEIKDNILRIKSKERYQQKIDYLNEQKANISPSFYDLCSKFFLIEYLDDLLYLFNERKEENIKQILLNYKDVIGWDDLIFSQTYKQFLLRYVLMLDPKFSEDYSGIKEYFNGKIRDYFLFNKIKTY